MSCYQSIATPNSRERCMYVSVIATEKVHCHISAAYFFRFL